MFFRFALAALLVSSKLSVFAQPASDLELRDGALRYRTASNGDRIPDFSYAGYRAGEAAIPTAPIVIKLSEPKADNTQYIQSAIDYVASLPNAENGIRGAILIPPGRYPISGALKIQHSGVVLRGSGNGRDGTTLVATGRDRRAVFEMRGQPARIASPRTELATEYVPVNSMEFNVADAIAFAAGDMLQIVHPSTNQWINSLKMDDFGGDRHGPKWRPGSRDLVWLRQLVKIEGNKLTLDAPLTYGLDRQFSVCTVGKLECQSLLRESGVENLTIESEYEHQYQHDEDHAWFGISIANARDVWVRRVTCKHLAGSAVAIWDSASRVTVEDCKNLAPVGEVGGHRRSSFFCSGQQVLLQRLFSERGFHDFSIGATSTGPNVFLECESTGSFAESGTIESAACATLMDRVLIGGNGLSLRNRGYQGQGTGWSSFNGLLWNCSASLIGLEKPPRAQNWAFGTHGEYNGDGAWSNSDDNVKPDSLYYAQLTERIGVGRLSNRPKLNTPKIQGSRAPTLEDAAVAVKRTWQPRNTLSQFIDQNCLSEPLPIAADSAQVWEELSGTASTSNETSKRDFANNKFEIINGWLTVNGALAIGSRLDVPWWSGALQTDVVAKAKPALTRFVPGRNGSGLTDDIDELVQSMHTNHQAMLWQHPPLWYDRRRDDHSRVQRMDGDVVAPFYETPWSRSGKGHAADGLSQWDLEKLNPWYFDRLEQFARQGASRGLYLFNGLYMQHSILEAGAHYVDAPWRPTNNVNGVELSEPVFFAGDKLIYIAEQFYDLSNQKNAGLHRTYQRNVLDRIAGHENVVLFLSEEFTGPENFVRYWLQNIATWSSETGKKPIVALYATKDVTEAMLADKSLEKVVTLIYNCYGNEGWWYQPDGSLYAPQGGKNLAPRQWIRLLKPKNPGFNEVHRAVREFRLKYPSKPFVYQGSEQLAWANLLGGGSLVPLPATTDADLLRAVVSMQPMRDQIGLADIAGNQLIYSRQPIPSDPGKAIRLIDMKTGTVVSKTSRTAEDPLLYWVIRQ